MNKEKLLNIDKGRYLLAISGGPDSMALLDMARNTDSYIEVGHVNYHKRDTALRDQKIVEEYCKKYHIVFHLYDFDSDDVKGNFQEKARIARYEFFAKICKERKLDAVLVGHQADDHLETYLMQKEKNLESKYYGIAPSNTLYGVKVIRPLLKYDKKMLEDYCKENDIVYGIDETNLENHYTRNRIRHETIEKLSEDERKELLEEIERKNIEKQDRLNRALSSIQDKEYEIDDFLNLEYLNDYLHYYFSGSSNEKIEEMLRQIKESKKCLFKSEKKTIVKEYGTVSINDTVHDYEYLFDSIDDLKIQKYEYFEIVDESDDFHGATVNDDDFPLTIRNYKEGDSIMMRYGTKKINRFFIDKKIRYIDRISWPIVLNSKGKVILVPEIGSDINHYTEKHNLFVIKL